MWKLGAALAVVLAVYGYGLTAVGMLGPDEPRFAAIGREMASSGDWVTPRLWGEPWFEKPALLYWLIAAGNLAGLGAEGAPRWPVALMSVAFLGFFWWRLRDWAGPEVAWLGGAMLATSAGWMAYSHVAVTDLPLACAYGGAMLLCLEWVERGEPRRLPAAGLLLGVAILAKGLVPVILALPLAWFGRHHWRHGWRLLAPAGAVAAPWYVLCYLKNGWPFVSEFFWRHHLERFGTDTLQHVQPLWFYVPVLAGLLFPWTGLLALVRAPGSVSEGFLFSLVAFGLLFFSLSVNKLPGYLLPLLPVLMPGLAQAALRHSGSIWALGAAGILLGASWPLRGVLPVAVDAGISHALAVHSGDLLTGVGAAVLITLPVALLGKRRLSLAAACLAVATLAEVMLIKRTVWPQVDALATARPLWASIQASPERYCVPPDLDRRRRYGLQYYANRRFPDCEAPPE